MTFKLRSSVPFKDTIKEVKRSYKWGGDKGNGNWQNASIENSLDRHKKIYPVTVDNAQTGLSRKRRHMTNKHVEMEIKTEWEAFLYPFGNIEEAWHFHVLEGIRVSGVSATLLQKWKPL